MRGSENVPQHQHHPAGMSARRPLLFGSENPPPRCKSLGGIGGYGGVNGQAGAGGAANSVSGLTVMGERTNLAPPAFQQWAGAGQGKVVTGGGSGPWGGWMGERTNLAPPAFQQWAGAGQGKVVTGGGSGPWGGWMGAQEASFSDIADELGDASDASVASSTADGCSSGMKRNRVPTPVKAAPESLPFASVHAGDANQHQPAQAGGGAVVPRALWEMLGFTGSPDKLLEEMELGEEEEAAGVGSGERRSLFAEPTGGPLDANAAASLVCNEVVTSPPSSGGSSKVEVKRPRRLRIFQEMTFTGAAA
eukprot:TRINITY_DN19683_c0_g1_i2.p3 TRINITY_DN19683_c0_g1~~TRINITY_DN19683_c0_g1_i2.p3  ORF type:complete len:306 (+),score=4.88 TRINITY_DN19683_c0_g1_i2:2224-3141(+)